MDCGAIVICANGIEKTLWSRKKIRPRGTALQRVSETCAPTQCAQEAEYAKLAVTSHVTMRIRQEVQALDLVVAPDRGLNIDVYPGWLTRSSASVVGMPALQKSLDFHRWLGT